MTDVNANSDVDVTTERDGMTDRGGSLMNLDVDQSVDQLLAGNQAETEPSEVVKKNSNVSHSNTYNVIKTSSWIRFL